jgi:hypothetical protein
MLGSWEPLDHGNLQPHQRRQDGAEAWDGAQQTNLRASFTRFVDTPFDCLDLLFEVIDRAR